MSLVTRSDMKNSCPFDLNIISSGFSVPRDKVETSDAEVISLTGDKVYSCIVLVITSPMYILSPSLLNATESARARPAGVKVAVGVVLALVISQGVGSAKE